MTWLYGPLAHVPLELEVKTAKAEDRLGLDTQVSPVKRATSKEQIIHPNHSHEEAIIKKPILKYRSLSDILTVPHLRRHQLHDFDELESPEDPTSNSSFNATSSEKTLSPSSENASELGSSTADDSTEYESEYTRDGRRKHIAFSNRVEQCIAVDSDEDRQRYAQGPVRFVMRARVGNSFDDNTPSSSEDEGDSSDQEEEEEQGLTFTTSRSPLIGYVGYSAAANLRRSSSGSSHKSARSMSGSSDCHLTSIAKLAPTMLKDSELLPSPSPVVVYPTDLLNQVAESDESDLDMPSQRHVETVDWSPSLAINSSLVSSSSTSTITEESIRQHNAHNGTVAQTLPNAPSLSSTPTVSPSASPTIKSIALPTKSILKTKTPPSSPSFFVTESSRGRTLSRGSSSSSLDRSSSRTVSASDSSAEMRRVSLDSSDSEAEDDSGKEDCESLERRSSHRLVANGVSPASAEDSYLADVDLSVWKEDKSSETWLYEFGESKKNPGIFTVVSEAIGTSFDVVSFSQIQFQDSQF